jgi:hypothetical protein
MESQDQRKFFKGGNKLVLAALLVGVLIGGVFWIRSFQTAETDQKLCNTIAQLLVESHPSYLEPGDYGYTYAQTHKDEWPKLPGSSQEQFRQAQARLGCTNLPSSVR